MIFDEFYIEKLEPDKLDLVLENGFRHFGTYFFRYSINIHEGNAVKVIPLRINLQNFKYSKSQKKILRKNSKFKHQISECVINTQIENLFKEHAIKFIENRPKSIYTFMNKKDPSSIPCRMNKVEVFDLEKLIAVSFLDIGENSTSSIYGMYSEEYKSYSLGIFTMLLEIEYSLESSKKFYYPGYVYEVPSFYDYKKQFYGLEYLDWQSNEWLSYERNFPI